MRRPRNKNRVLSRAAILSQAKQLFSQKGYRGTSIQDLTAKFGASRPALYYHFKSKIEILSELHSTAFNRLVEGFNEIEKSEIPLKEKFAKIIANHATVVTKNADLVRVFFQDEREIPTKLKQIVYSARKNYTNKIIKLYAEGAKQGIFRNEDPRIMVYLILGSCNWLCMWYSEKKANRPDEIVRMLTLLACKGYEEGS
jgi:AcrR family transcriptional regulator